MAIYISSKVVVVVVIIPSPHWGTLKNTILRSPIRSGPSELCEGAGHHSGLYVALRIGCIFWGTAPCCALLEVDIWWLDTEYGCWVSNLNVDVSISEA